MRHNFNMSSRKLSDLHPLLQPLAARFLNSCQANGLEILVTCTYRSNTEQAILYEYGRTVSNPYDAANPWAVVTNAKAGESEHNFTIDGKPASKAFDIVPTVHGFPIWSNARHPVWVKVREVWQRGFVGDGCWLDWYGRSDAKFYELCHFCLKEDKP